MKKLIFLVFILRSFNVFSGTTTEMLASIDLYKDKSKPIQVFELERIKTVQKITYQISLKGIKKKKITEEQTLNITSEINKLIWDYEYKSNKVNKICKKVYAKLKVEKESVTICKIDKMDVNKTLSLLSRLNKLVK